MTVRMVKSLFRLVNCLISYERFLMAAKLPLVIMVKKPPLQAGKSRYTLATLPARDFPENDQLAIIERIRVPEAALKELIERTAFAMAQQDVRYYLNGLLFDLKGKTLRCVSTDGHRLRTCVRLNSVKVLKIESKSSCQEKVFWSYSDFLKMVRLILN